VGAELRRVLRDRGGNTFIIVTAALMPLLAMVGGAVDIGRSYVTETRLQQACDAGVLAARKQLGSKVATTGVVPADVSTVGYRFFNINFPADAFGTEGRTFTMALEADTSISGRATVTVPTTVMRIFGDNVVPVAVNCQAKLNFTNTDVMMVLDTTGSMADINPGDTQPKIAILRQVVKAFHAQLEASKSPGVRIRYGFVPYSNNVNVGTLLKSGWMVDSWNYEGRVSIDTGKGSVTTYKYTYTPESGAKTAISAYKASACPGDTATFQMISYGSGSGYEVWDTKAEGDAYTCTSSGSTYTVTGYRYIDYVYRTLKQANGTTTQNQVWKWQYKSVPVNVSSFRDANPGNAYKGGTLWLPMAGDPQASPTMLSATFKGCIEERDTYEITDYANVDLSRALDLDLDLVPTAGKPATQWRPMLHEVSFLRSWKPTGGSWSKAGVTTTDSYMQASNYGLSVCPSPARKLATMTAGEVAAYVDGLVVGGGTYHDIGMIWGGRLLSPTGLFASENADLNRTPTSRHLIFLTDGETAPLDLIYGSYGVEPLSTRRWSPTSKYNLTETVEKRFIVACNEVKKRNVTIWVIGFGTGMTDLLKTCAGDGHWFQADNAAQLNNSFDKIAKSMGDLRIVS